MIAFSKEELLAAERVFASERRRVRFQDVDAASTIYFPKVLEYFGDCYMALLTASGLDVPGMLRERRLAAPLAHAEADYLSPLFFGDEVLVEIVKAVVGETSLTLGHRIKKGERVTSLGRTVHVFIDPHSFKPVPVPAELARALA